ncbi:TetR/AcrR family transcriptional regulator [Glutamicibacter halophytocola]|uniref:TetR/AcrR family transcriptional regulator n=1 Tax=Glutamicibacter halophytocola TaxID=1933880 RepID=A0AA94XWM3_9MICC|nr:TetR/AcrR family transcriptional regulator [Glutamicibacter halophytocola]UUX58417.1 TetR/AcrR family transcriptional regulator [Glutamicibacter halophytocola]
MIINSAERLLAESATGDISTRAVCEAAGVTQPVLYRHFGDKDGLLAAVADHVWENYLSAKRSTKNSDDALEDLRRGWDNHTAFALENPHAYRLVFGTALAARPAAMGEAMKLLVGFTSRLAAEGRLLLGPEQAARVIMAANSGLALGLILRGDADQDPKQASYQSREATLRGILSGAEASASPAAQAATTLRAQLAESSDFTPAEAYLLNEWLDRFQAGNKTK